ncbi:hypothetical protein HD806DRAFT_479394 [Xylariaceae sp. AK1471]|nr:hypothetical protein HD806DRAFT_479394 [Xylariaceae sp. AK1471]
MVFFLAFLPLRLPLLRPRLGVWLVVRMLLALLSVILGTSLSGSRSDVFVWLAKGQTTKLLVSIPVLIGVSSSELRPWPQVCLWPFCSGRGWNSRGAVRCAGSGSWIHVLLLVSPLHFVLPWLLVIPSMPPSTRAGGPSTGE